ncbi:TPA: hypothetical protein MYK46_000524 [Klebsiella pneumoniae]|nr:hypothetical protein [Klebsiella pneumoniae]HCA9634949.1 hypothetical protein [Klebsiella pneumoniae]HCB0286536.1 hypothetical protein [Klebsiella pneumoniae]HCB4666423.1 hypothetical protein [Klebsiella pneumoniae]
MDVISIIMAAGKSSVDVALYTLLPIMVIMLIIMKYLEVRGILDVIVRWVAPLLKPFGLTGMSAFALIQINFVSFAAPLATLSIMDKRGVSAGLLIQTFDLPGIGIFLGISSRFVRLFRFVAPAAIVGILLRTVLHLILF